MKWRCSVCGEEKPVEEMIRDATRVRGRKKRCKPCHAELNKALRQKKGANELRGRPKRGKWMFHPRLFKNIKS